MPTSIVSSGLDLHQSTQVVMATQQTQQQALMGQFQKMPAMRLDRLEMNEPCQFPTVLVLRTGSSGQMQQVRINQPQYQLEQMQMLQQQQQKMQQSQEQHTKSQFETKDQISTSAGGVPFLISYF